MKIFQLEIQNNNAQYLQKIENLLFHEEQIFETILPQCESAIKAIISAFDEELIEKFKSAFLQKDTGFIYMLAHNQFDVSYNIAK